jgi:hypothetical protein
MNSEMKVLHDRQVDLQARSMKNNMIFNETNDEKCENKLTSFLKNNLEIDIDIQFDRVHLMGKRISKELGLLLRNLFN